MRTTLSMARNSRIPEAINVKPTDDRFVSYLNEAIQRLMFKGHWWGTYGTYRTSATSQFFVLPPQMDTVEAVAIARVQTPLHDQWFEFLQFGWPTRDDTLPNGSGVNEVLYRGSFPTIVDISTAGTLTVKCDVAQDVGKTVLILGYDASGNWIRTLVGGAWQDGEPVLMAQAAGTATVNSFSRITDIQPPDDLEGQWWLYLGAVIGGTLLGNFQYWETSPSYKRYLIPFVNSTVSTVEVIGKFSFVPVKNPTDYLLIGNLNALKLACMACKAEEEHNWGEANLLWNGGKDKDGVMRIGAMQELDSELDHNLGSGRQIGMNFTGSGYGGDAVETLV